MIASYPGRRFQVWEYRVSHGSLLIRSPKSLQIGQNIDLVFVGVEYMSVPRLLRGVVLEHGADEDVLVANVAIGDVDRDRVFVLVSEGRRHLVVASACQVDENDGDVFGSPFLSA